MKTPICYIITAVLLLSSCDYFLPKKQQHDKVLARVEGKELRLSHVQGIFPDNISSEDSIALLRNYIDSWVRKCLMAAKAEKHLHDNRKDISHELDNYRMSLLAYRYEMQYLEEKLDTHVSEEELLAYYEQHPENLSPITKPQVRIIYIKLNDKTEGIDRIKQALSEHKDRQYLDSVCTLAKVYPYLSNQWYDLSAIASNFPFTVAQSEAAIRNGTPFLKTTTGEIIHLLAFREIRRRMEAPAMEQLMEQYYTTIMNKRRQEQINKLVNDVYIEALDNQRIKIYIDE